MKVSFASILILVALAGQGCKPSQASSTAVQKVDRLPENVGAERPVGCHPIDAATQTGEAQTKADAPANRRPTSISDDMVLIKGGSFTMGASDGLPAESPVHRVTVKSFWIDRHEVTVAQFGEFVKAIGYQTEAEKAGWSGVFNSTASRWQKIDGADWQHPEGPSSSAPLDEPVTHVSWNDAVAYASWARKQLPTEAEFEYTARGGLAEKKYAWGDELNPSGEYRANYWQGVFPTRNLGEDGFFGRAPVGSFPPNGYGLYDMTGNVWEWCADWFDENFYAASPSVDPRGPADGEDRIIRGGSWLCSENYCTGYRVAARNHTSPDTGLNNLGFRCVRGE